MADYTGLMGELTSIDPPLFVFGSIAEAVLLDGALSPTHADLDLLISRDQLVIQVHHLRELGFADFDVYYEPRPGLPMVLGSARGDLNVELSLIDRDTAGHPYFAVQTENGVVAIAMPDDMFVWPPTTIAGVPIRTVSPLALIHIRAGLIETRAFGPPRPEKDQVPQARLRQTFFPEADEASLRPEVSPCT